MTSDRERLTKLRPAWNRAAITETNRTKRRIASAAINALDDVPDTMDEEDG